MSGLESHELLKTRFKFKRPSLAGTALKTGDRPMASKWYFTRNGRDRLGPFTSKQLRQLAATGQLVPTDMVLKEGNSRWVEAGSIPKLFPRPAEPVEEGHAGFGWKEVEGETDQPPPHQPDNEDLAPTQFDNDFAATTRKTLWQALAITGCFVLIVGVILLTVFQPEVGAAIVSGIIVVLLAAFLIGGVTGLILFITGTLSACPECKKWWARVYLGRRIVEQKKCYGLVTRTAHTSSSGTISGTCSHSGSFHHTGNDGRIHGTTHSSGSTSWEERVPVIRTTYDYYYACKHCRVRWTEEKVNEVEDFDIERD
jgi:hypothetical protein